MATHSSVLAWRIPGTEEPGGLQSIGVAQSWTQLKRLSSSSSSSTYTDKSRKVMKESSRPKVSEFQNQALQDDILEEVKVSINLHSG